MGKKTKPTLKEFPMDKTIKTREVTHDIKSLNKKAIIAENLKSTTIRTKDRIEEESSQPNSQQTNGSHYAQDKTEQNIQTASTTAAQVSSNSSKKVIDSIKQRRSVARQSAKNVTPQRLAIEKGKQAAANAQKINRSVVKQSTRTTVKTAQRATKTAQTTAKTTVKTSRQAVQGAKSAAKTTQVAARSAAQATRAASKAAVATAKAVAKATVAMVKAVIASGKALVSAIAAGGGIAVAAILIICMVALIVASAFGIFFSSNDTNDGNPAMQQVIADINNERAERIEQIKQDSAHDDLIMTGSQTPWKETLAVFAVKTTTDPTNPLDVITLDEHRCELLRTIYWEMNALSSHVEDREVVQVTVTDDGNGNLVEESTTVTIRTLYIEQVSFSADEMAERYSFSNAQLTLLHDLLDPQYDSMWTAVLYGVHNGSGDIVEVAVSQIGNVGGQPYWSWYGFGSRVEWCACFVSWCANECGYIEAGIFPKFAACQSQGISWFSDRGQYQGRGYVPSPGDIIFFDWEGDGISDHVGIVESCDGSYAHTIEGNSGDACRRSTYSVNSSSICGYGTPAY
jgi:hypothetical protein